MKDCTNSALLDSLKHCQGETILPGIRTKVYFTPFDDITAWPALPKTAATAMNEIVKYKGNFTLAADKKWKVIDLTLNKGQVTWETQGEDPSVTVLNKAELTHPNIDEDAAAFSSVAHRIRGVYVIQTREGKFRVLGAEAFDGALTKLSGGTGEGVTSTDAGTKLSVEATDAVVAPFYEGTLDTDEGEVDCSGNPSESA